MARYSTFKYGDGTKYGTAPTNDNLLWTFVVDWDGSGTFSGIAGTFNNEALRMTDLRIRRGRDYLIRPGGTGLEHYDIGEVVAVFDNSDGRYDPWDSSSPLFPYVKPGKFVRIKVKDGAGGTDYGIMKGTIADIQPFIRNNDNFVKIVVKDGLRWLKDRAIEKGLQSSQRVDQCIVHVLDGADWPDEWGGMASLSASVDTLTYWWGWKTNALRAIQQLEEAELGVFFQDNDGVAIFRGRDYTFAAEVVVPESVILTDLILPQPWELVRNRIEIYSYPKLLDTINTTIWQLRDIPAIADGEALTFDAIFKYETWQPCGSSIAFNHTVNAQADGGGADLTANCPLTYNSDIGDGAEMTITNNSGSDGYIILLRAVGDAIYAPDQTIRKANDTDSEDDYGPRTLIINSPWQEDSETAQTQADLLLDLFKDPTSQPIIRFENRPSYQFGYDLYDRVSLDLPSKGIYSTQFRIGRIEHQWLSPNGSMIQTTWGLEPYLREGDVAYKGALAYRITSNQSIPSAASTDMEFNSEVHDTNTFHDTVTNPERMTIPSGLDGYYRYYVQVKFDNNATGVRILYVKLNGGGTAIAEYVADATSEDMIVQVVSTYLLSAGDYLEVEVYQNSGGAIDVMHGIGNTFFGIDFLGEA